jgi:hypothetical protein
MCNLEQCFAFWAIAQDDKARRLPDPKKRKGPQERREIFLPFESAGTNDDWHSTGIEPGMWRSYRRQPLDSWSYYRIVHDLNPMTG